ncbi:hypothetical protein [Candidatus Methylacidithermus pantelleriae]|uniref:Uncharacterized protein n=1 Tax=Candidatus Methylacidithermus pantelleriae TaxID=2744239 RepID=A0A8J2BUJ1_9BACT|nr:hypothetical protein [Candidatus Methylacidithermus pantelleriae]CAF0701729.1 conserved membrane hypothetical protein [Candidatus Methylacidithermus pantelleriae]
MNSAEIARMVGTIIVLGFCFVLSAGLYAGLYTAGRMFRKTWLIWVSSLFALGQFLAAVGMVMTGYLDPFWRYLVAASALAYLAIPPAMWRVVIAFHRSEERPTSREREAERTRTEP